MKTLSLITAFFLLLGIIQLNAQPAPTGPQDTKVSLQFPNNPVGEVASYYELLTKKRLIRDSNLTGPNLSISVAEPVTEEEAVALIEAAFLLNGYTMVPVDAKTAKLLGPTKQPRSESVPLFSNEAQLPDADQVVSYFMPFRFIGNDEAATIFASYVAVRPYGSIVPVPNANALVITENVPLIRRLIALQKVIDVPGTKSSSVFFSLQRADATKVAEFLSKLFEKNETAGPKAPQPLPNQPAPGNDGAVPQQPAVPIVHLNVQIIPDTRTNRIMVVAPEQEMPYIRNIVESLDQSASFEEPYERPLRFVLAADVLPVLANLLSEGQDSKQQSAAVNSNAQASNLAGQNASIAEASGGGGGGNGPGAASKPDMLRAPSESVAPLSLVVGNSRIVADRSANKIIVIGPPESRFKAARVLQLLDQRPKQIYLAVVIGQLTLGKGVDFGIDYLAKFGNVKVLGQGNASTINNLAQARAGVDVVPGTSQVVNAANTIAQTATQAVAPLASTILPVVSGLSLFGTIGDSIDVYVHALSTSDKFKVISRPVVYTANNKKAVISSGQSVPVPQTTLTTAVSAQPSGAATSSTIEYVPVVLKLEVIPTINSNNEVTLTIAQQNDSVQQQVVISNNQVPVIGTQELTTTVTVPNRQTVILGGLITEQEERTQTGIPYLRDIPGLGYLFASTKKDLTRRELIILIQPFIIDAPGELEEANVIERQNSSLKNESAMFQGQVPVKKALLPDLPGAPKPKPLFPALQNP